MTTPALNASAPAPVGECPQAPTGNPASATTPLRDMVSMPPVACISSGSLLAGSKEVLIEHHGAMYRLKQTALGKLILTK